jgi:hypothetical protein
MRCSLRFLGLGMAGGSSGQVRRRVSVARLQPPLLAQGGLRVLPWVGLILAPVENEGGIPSGQPIGVRCVDCSSKWREKTAARRLRHCNCGMG